MAATSAEVPEQEVGVEGDAPIGFGVELGEPRAHAVPVELVVPRSVERNLLVTDGDTPKNMINIIGKLGNRSGRGPPPDCGAPAPRGGRANRPT